jgi:hypothetical protein
VESVPSIHYVWWGNPGNPQLQANATATPNIMVELVKGVHTVHYWIGGNAGFDAPLDTRIHQHPLGSNPGALLHGTKMSHLASRMKEILTAFHGFRAYAAAKDLVSFAVMYSQGGYFFDTTTQIGEGYRPHIKRLLAERKEPHAPYNTDESCGHNFIPANETGKFTVDFGVGPMAMFGYDDNLKVRVPAFDVWALYSPKRHHKAFERALGSYLTRAWNVGFGSPNTSTLETFGGKNLSTIMNEVPTEQQKKNPDFKAARDQVIGGLSISSLLEGFYSYSKGRNLRDLGWPYSPINRMTAVQKKQPQQPKPQQPKPQQPQQPPKRKVQRSVPSIFVPNWFAEPFTVTVPRKGNEGQDKVLTGDEALEQAIFAGMGLANVTVPEIGIQKWFSGSWRSRNL